jgi:hypothetical protein
MGPFGLTEKTRGCAWKRITAGYATAFIRRKVNSAPHGRVRLTKLKRLGGHRDPLAMLEILRPEKEFEFLGLSRLQFDALFQQAIIDCTYVEFNVSWGDVQQLEPAIFVCNGLEILAAD